MKNKTLLGIIAALALAGMAHGAAATNAGPPALHYVTRYVLSDAVSNVVASLNINFHDKGAGALQKFDLTATNLAKLTTYSLVAVLGLDTNPVEVATFTTDKKGRVKLSLIELPGGGSGGKTNRILPPLLNPLSAVHAVGIVDPFGQLVGFASLATPVTYIYQIKRNLDRVDPLATPAGSIDLKANTTGANFKLKADGLLGSGVYYFSLNSTVFATVVADTKGRMQIIGWPYGAPAVPALQSLELFDSLSNLVLSTTFGQ